jgi:hypothetical protein
MGALKQSGSASYTPSGGSSLLPQREKLGDIIEVGGISIDLDIFADKASQGAAQRVADLASNPEPSRNIRMQAANSDAEAARARIAQVEDEIQKLQDQIDALNTGGGCKNPYISPCIRISPRQAPRPSRKPIDKRKIAKTVGAALDTDLCSCHDRLPKPMTAQVDLWSTRTTGRRQRTLMTFVEQAIEVHDVFTLQNVQVLWAPARELPLTTRVAGMCKSGGSESCRDQSLMETEARLSASLTPTVARRKEASARRKKEEEEAEEEEDEATEIWAAVRGKRGVRDHAPPRTAEQQAMDMHPRPLSSDELRRSPVVASPLREQRQRVADEVAATTAATASLSQVRVCMEEV